MTTVHSQGSQVYNSHYFGWEEGEKGWTADIKAAFKFDTRDEAEKMAGDCGLPDYQIRDHKWLDHKPTSNLDVA